MFFVQSNISVQNKLNFLVTYSKYCIDTSEARLMSEILSDFSVFLDSEKVCRKYAWILYYISTNNIDNLIYFVHFIPLIRFNEYQKDQKFLKPYLMFFLSIFKKSLEICPNELAYKMADDLFNNQDELFQIAFFINDSNPYITIHTYRLLKLIYLIKIQSNENVTKNINALIDLGHFDYMIQLCQYNEFDIIESIIMFLSILLPFIERIDKLSMLLFLIPKISEMINSSDIRPLTKMMVALFHKFKPYKEQLNDFLNLILDNNIIEQVRSFVFNNNLNLPDILEECKLLEKASNENL